MPQLPSGNKITATEFNDLVDLYDSYWRGGSYSFDPAHNTDTERRKGWGQIPVVPVVNTAMTIESLHFNQLGAQVNAGLWHINSNNSLIPKRKPNADYQAEKDIILLSYYNDIENNISVTINNNKFNTVFSSPNIQLGLSNGGTAWDLSTSCEIKSSFTTYDAARHYFNSGGQITLELSAVGSGAELWNPIFDSFGEISIGAVYTGTSGGNPGIQFGGFYGIRPDGEERMTIVLYNGSGGGEYGAYGAYGTYGSEYGSRNVRVYLRAEQTVDSFDVYARVELNEDEEDGVIITADITLEVGSDTPETIPSQGAFIADGVEYLFRGLTDGVIEEPTVIVSTNWP